MSELDAQLAEMIELPYLEDESLGYEWDEFRAWYDPKARIFYWGDASGCSCYYYWSEFHTLGDFQNGHRDALIRAANDWRPTSESVTSQQFTRFLDAVRAVK